MNKKTTDIVAYITIIGWLIAYFTGDKENCRFHLNQGLAFGIVELALWVLGCIFWGIIGILLNIVGFVVFIFAIICLINAAQGEEWSAPLIGQWQLLK